MEKLLPIKVFEIRKVDELKTEGGGNNKLPSWVLQSDELVEHARGLTQDMSYVAAEFHSYEDEKHDLPMVITTTVSEQAIAKSHRGSVVDLLNSDKQSNVIGIEADYLSDKEPSDLEDTSSESMKNKPTGQKETRRILSIITSDTLIDNINKILQDTDRSAKLISSIAKIAPFEAKTSGYNPQNKKYYVRLIDYQDRDRNILAQKLFRNKCVDFNISIEKETRYSADMRLFRVSLDSSAEMKSVQGFDGVYSIVEAIPLKGDLDSLSDAAKVKVKKPVEGRKYPVVGVLDSGIERNRYLAPWIMKNGEEYYETKSQDRSHGSMVASVLEYSDELNGTNDNSEDGVMMLDSVVVPDLKKEFVYIDDIIDNVRDTIERHPEVKIWTMSVGTSEECPLDQFSEAGIALDNIADENDVLIVKSVGNSYAFFNNADSERIAKMADSVRALVIGSIANEKGQYDLAEINMPSPFTRKGPGPEHIIKPDLVGYGGNAGILPNGRMTTTGVRVFDKEGVLSQAQGTSFSTPWVARIASELEFSLDGRFDPLLIKALLIHNAGYPAGERLPMNTKRDFMGFGMPQGTREILYNSENEITLILRDTLQKGTFIDILDFPFAASLIGDDGYYHGQIILTMVSSPILRPSEGPEYCQSNIKVSFGTMERIKERDVTKRTVRNPYGPDNPVNLMKETTISTKVTNILEDNSFGRERTLISYGTKYQPIKKYAIDLDEVKPSIRKEALNGKRQWFMKVEALFRDAVEREARKTGEILETDFCLLLTVRDPSGKAPVYNEITQQLQAKNFIYSNIHLKNEVKGHIHIDEDIKG